MVLRVLIAVLMVLGALAPLKADDAAPADGSAFQRIISEQIAAFNADDGPKAFSYASPNIQRVFPTPDVFMSMVRQGYAPVYRQRSFAFGQIITDPVGRPAQEVTIIDLNGKAWTAIYSMEKQPDGTWKISGCSLIEVPGTEA